MFARPDSSLTSGTPLNGLVYLTDSLICTICLIFDGHLLGKIKSVAVLGCAFLKTTIVTIIIGAVCNFSTPVLGVSLFSAPVLILLFILMFPAAVDCLLLPLKLGCLGAALMTVCKCLVLVITAIASFILKRSHFS